MKKSTLYPLGGIYTGDFLHDNKLKQWRICDDIGFIYLGHLGWCNLNRSDPICVKLSKVNKASLVLLCRLRFHEKCHQCKWTFVSGKAGGSIHNTSYDNFRIIFKIWVLYKTNWKSLCHLCDKEPYANNDFKSFVRSFVNTNPGSVFATLLMIILQSLS